MTETIVISGAGPVGCLLGLLLSKNPQNRVWVIEKRKDPRQVASPDLELKSINLALSDRGRAALRAVGLENAVLSQAVELTGRLVHNGLTKPSAYQQYDDVEGKKSIYSVSRPVLNNILLDHLLVQPNVVVSFDVRIVALHQNEVKLSNGETHPCAAVFGCDGTYSSVRESMSRICNLDFHRTYINLGYSELTIPKGSQLEMHCLHIWPKESENHMMLIALPNQDGSFTATLFAPFNTLLRLQENEANFHTFMDVHFPECIDFLPKTTCRAHPLFTSTVSPWTDGKTAVLMGDAAHTQVPFFGQGLNAGLEDALVFFETLSEQKGQNNWVEAMITFDSKRRPCGEAITVLSLENYVEMHTSSNQLWFRWSRRVQGFFSRILPTVSYPLYYQVAFSRRPYDEILKEKKSGGWYWWYLQRFGIVGGLVVGFVSVSRKLTKE